MPDRLSMRAALLPALLAALLLMPLAAPAAEEMTDPQHHGAMTMPEGSGEMAGHVHVHPAPAAEDAGK